MTATERAVVAFVDDDDDYLEELEQWDALRGVTTRVTHDQDECLAWVKAGTVDVVVSDLKMPGIGGVSLLQRVADIRPSVRRALLSGFEPKADEMARLQASQSLVLRKTDDMQSVADEILRLASAEWKGEVGRLRRELEQYR